MTFTCAALAVASVGVLLFPISNAQSKYFMDNDNDLNRYFAFPMGVCLVPKPVTEPEIYVKYDCSLDETTVYKQYFTDSQCESVSVDYGIASFPDTAESPCGTPLFSCDGRSDGWQLMGFSQAQDCDTIVGKLPVVTGCFCDTAASSYHTNCTNEVDEVARSIDVSTGIIREYDSSANCSGNATNIVDTTECQFFGQVLGSINLRATLEECRWHELTLPPTPAPTDPPETGSVRLGAYQYLMGVFFGFMILIGVAALIDAKLIRKNDFFLIGAVASMTLQTADMISDCFFSADLYGRVSDNPDSPAYQILFYLSLFFIVFPALFALLQLYFYAKKNWVHNEYVNAWLSKYSVVLLALSLFSGSSFAAVALLNSYIFQLEYFDMGLTEKQMRDYNTRRIWSVVLFENAPQIVLQATSFGLSGKSIFDAQNVIVLSSMAFSLISIVISVLSLTLEKALSKTQNRVVITMDVTGDCVQERVKQCRTMNYQVLQSVSSIIGVPVRSMEVVKPVYVKGGLGLDIIVYIGMEHAEGTIEYDQALKDSVSNGQLQGMVLSAWGLREDPFIDNITQQILDKSEGPMINTNRAQRILSLSQIEPQGNRHPVSNDSATDNGGGRTTTNMASSPSSTQQQDRVRTTSTSSNPRKMTADWLKTQQEAPPPPSYNPNAREYMPQRKSRAQTVDGDAAGGRGGGGGAVELQSSSATKVNGRSFSASGAIGGGTSHARPAFSGEALPEMDEAMKAAASGVGDRDDEIARPHGMDSDAGMSGEDVDHDVAEHAVLQQVESAVIAKSLEALKIMGYDDQPKCIHALNQCDGDLMRTVEFLKKQDGNK